MLDGTNAAAFVRSGMLKPGGGAAGTNGGDFGSTEVAAIAIPCIGDALMAAGGDQTEAEEFIRVQAFKLLGMNNFASVESFFASSVVCRDMGFPECPSKSHVSRTETKGLSKLQEASESGGCAGSSGSGMTGGASTGGGGGGAGGVEVWPLQSATSGTIAATYGLLSDCCEETLSPEEVSQSDSDGSDLSDLGCREHLFF